jgi:hypothetical protein
LSKNLLCRKTREPGRGHDDQDRPAIIAWVSRQGPVVVQAVKDCTVATVQKAAAIAVQAGRQLSTDSASRYRALQGYRHDFVNHTQQEYARGAVHENRAECLFSLELVVSFANGPNLLFGIARDPEARLNALQTGHYVPLKLAFSRSCKEKEARMVDRFAHQLLAAKHLYEF